MRCLLIAIHGILTRQTDASWPDRLDAWMFQRDPEVKVLKKEYAAGPFPRWNCWIKDPRLARSLVNEIELFVRDRQSLPQKNAKIAKNQPGCPNSEALGSPFRSAWSLDRTIAKHPQGAPACPDTNSSSLSSLPSFAANSPCPPIWFIAHSNGAVIALLVTKRLIERGYWVGGLILTGAACEADLRHNGVFEWCRADRLGAALAYSSEDDAVVAGDPRGPQRLVWKLRDWLWGKLMWPYGSLGRTGWMLEGVRFPGRETDRVFTRWFAGGHSAYFSEANCERTFAQIYQDLHWGSPALDSQPAAGNGFVPQLLTLNSQPL